MLDRLLKDYAKNKNTCSVTNLQDNCVTFIRGDGYLKYLRATTKIGIVILIPKNKKINITFATTGMTFLQCDYPEYEFVRFHNYIHRRDWFKKVVYKGKRCKIHKTAILDAEGLKLINAPNGSKIQFKHTGTTDIGSDVEIGPYTVIHRGTMDSTMIFPGVKIGSKNNIGHNNMIGNDTVIAAGVVTNGSVMIGDNCWIGSGSIIKNGVTICDNVILGMGSVVSKNIDKPGIYTGMPARYIKKGPDNWNF